AAQDPGFSVEGRADAADEAVAFEDRHDEVPELTLRLRDVDLDPIAKAEEELRAVSVTDEVVERRKERGARMPVAVSETLGQREILGADEPRPGQRALVARDMNACDHALAFEPREH